MSELSPLIEIDSNDGKTRKVTFTSNGEYLVSGGHEGVRVWRLRDGKRTATMPAALEVQCLAASTDGRWIAAGTYWGWVFVWNANTYEQVFMHRDDRDIDTINGVDFSPDSTRLVTASDNCTAIVWNIAARQRVLGPLRHKDWLRAAKYSPQGDRIATATGDSVRLYDSNDGCLLVDIEVNVTPYYNTGLLWSNERLFVVSDGKIKQFNAPTWSTPSDSWPVSNTSRFSCAAILRHEEFIAYSTNQTVTFRDTSTHTQLGLIRHSQDVRSIALSPDNRFLAIGGAGGKITIHSLSHITAAIPLYRLHPTFQEPEILIDDAVLNLWMHGHLANAEALLTAAITQSQSLNHHLFSSRALVRARLRYWDAAIIDAEKSIKIQPSVVGYIAKSVALVCKGKKHKAYRACDIAFERFHSTHVSYLLLIKAIIVFLAGEHEDAISRIDDLVAMVPFNSTYYVVQAYMYLLLGKSCMESRDYKNAVQFFECAKGKMQRYGSRPLSVIPLIFGWMFDNLGVTIQQRLCEALYAAGRVKDAGESLLKMINTNTFNKGVNTHSPMTKWICDFTHRCLSTPRVDGDHKALLLHANINPTVPVLLLREWARSSLASVSWKDTLVGGVNFTVPRFMIYRVICECLETIDRISDASQCFHQMAIELAHETPTHGEQAKWVLNFKLRCSRRLEILGDIALNDGRHDDCISHFSAALSLDLAAPQGLLVKRNKAYLAKGLWEDALNDANKVIMLDPLSPWGYERRHAALHKAGDYENAIAAFEAMLSKISQSGDEHIRAQHLQYINPGETKIMIRRAVQDAIRESPRVLINTTSGRLFNKSEQASAFETLPIFKELVSSMTTHIDHARIEQEVTNYYRYATFSHKWEENEPLFEKVINVVVYDLEDYPTHDKLQTFCKIVRDAGFRWAWSDTCCINKADHFVLQEALVAMFKWYQSSSLTIVLLRGVCSPSRRGDLVRSIWNTRAWTFQEYHASNVVRFYSEDWTPYLNLGIPNHKESPEIISEMEEATGVSARALVALRPGLNDIREKLCLASRRETTLVEDTAYSLLGIFSVSLPIVYGEGDKALGRLLAQLLTSSGDTSILAWSGRSGSFNSCLPAKITVFDQLPTTHIPVAMSSTEMDAIAAELRGSSSNLELVMKLHDRLNELALALFAGQRMKLPCLAFKLGPVITSASWSTSGRVFRAQTDALGIVEIRTKEDLSRLESLYLIYPWIDFLLDRQLVRNAPETAPTETADDRSSVTPPRDAAPLLPPEPISEMDKQLRALQCVTRLRQPFGALLFTPTRQNVAEYRRVASESTITVQVQEDTPLNVLIDSARMLDVL